VDDHDHLHNGCASCGRSGRAPVPRACSQPAVGLGLHYVATWPGWSYVAFVIDAFADRIVGWRVKTTKDTGLVFDALEQAVHTRLPAAGADGELIAHADAATTP
jgi:transposase InsO family protein